MNQVRRKPPHRRNADHRQLCRRGRGHIRSRWRNRKGVSLLELVIAGSMLAGVMTGLSFVMRTARQSWDTIDSEYAVLQQMQAVARHFVRTAREANGVSTIASDGSGITLSLPDDQTASWNWTPRRNGRQGVVIHRSPLNPSGAILAGEIDSLQFTGFTGDGVTATTATDDIQVVQITIAVTVPRSAVPQRTIQSKVWIRSW